MTLIVAIDSATRWAGVALYNSSQAELIAENSWQSDQRHTVEMAPRLAAMLQRAQVSWEEVRLLAVAQGPGSYTGVRIGISLAKGIALARHISIVPVPTLDIIAYAWRREERPLCALLQAGRKRLVWAFYRRGPDNLLAPPEIGFPADLLSRPQTDETFFCGEIDTAVRTALLAGNILPERIGSPADCARRPGYLAERAAEIATRGGLPASHAIAPIYIRPTAQL